MCSKYRRDWRLKKPVKGGGQRVFFMATRYYDDAAKKSRMLKVWQSLPYK
jgi:hypothetical protein